MTTVSVEYAAQDVRRVLVPDWVQSVIVEARTDGADLVTVEATRRFEQEQWLITPVHGDPSTLVAWVILGGGDKAVDESRARVKVLVPPSRRSSIDARAGK